MAEPFDPGEFHHAWNAFCDCDYHLIGMPYDDFVNHGEKEGLFALRAVEPDDLEESFAWERGIEMGGSLWELTPKGRALFDQCADDAGGAK